MKQLKTLQEAVGTARAPGTAPGMQAGPTAGGAAPIPVDVARRGDLTVLSSELSSSIAQLKCADNCYFHSRTPLYSYGFSPTKISRSVLKPKPMQFLHFLNFSSKF